MSLAFHDRQHLQKVLIQQREIADIFNRFIVSVSPQLKKWTDTGKKSVWVRNLTIENAIDKELINLQSQLINNISSFQVDAWKRSNLKNDELVKQFIEGMSLSHLTKQGMFGQNLEALRQLQQGIDNGMNLSQRVWNITEQAKTQLEFYLGSGVSVGRSADTISRDVRQLLDNPDKRFRRIRNDKGELILSRPMKDYHPGTGVYRSAKMNALRMSSTETNRGYRLADHERWQKLDFVLGFEVKRSGNHKGACKVCDPLVGKYPKSFVFTGWHPFCICFAIPVLMNHEDFANYLLDDVVSQEQIVLDIPEKAKAFIGDNKETFKRAYWVRDNFVKGDIGNGLNTQIHWNDNSNEVYKIIAVRENEIRKNKSFETLLCFDDEGSIFFRKRGGQKQIAFTEDEIKNFKDKIITHNHPGGWHSPEGSMHRIGSSFSKEDILMAIHSDAKEIRAVTPNYTFYMKRPAGGWGITVEEANKIISLLNKEQFDKMWERINNNTTTRGKAGVVHWHQIWKIFSQKYNIEYGKKKTI